MALAVRDTGEKTFFVGVALMAAVSLTLTALVIPTGGHLIALFGAGQEAVAIGDNFFRRIASFYLVYGLATAVRSYLEGMGDVVYSSAAGIISLLCRIAASYALAAVFSNMVIGLCGGIFLGGFAAAVRFPCALEGTQRTCGE